MLLLRCGLLLGLAALFLPGAAALELRIDNRTGAVSVTIVQDNRFEMRHSSPVRDVTPEDVSVERSERLIEVTSQPPDQAPIHIEISAPFGIPIQVRTAEGSISLEGYPALFTAVTVSGELRIAAPWEATRFLMIADQKPERIETPRGFRFRQDKGSEFEHSRWLLRDTKPELEVTYGSVRLRAERPTKVVLEHSPLPPEAPIKMPWQSEAVLERLEKNLPAPEPAAAPPPTTHVGLMDDELPPGEVVFSSDVRMVNLAAAVYGPDGRPLVGLGAADFEVLENGVPQDLAAAGTEDEPFNLAILLDLSTSTDRNRDEMKRIARGFAGIARPSDRIAVYALTRNWFAVVSPLTSDHGRTIGMIENLPQLGGGSPVYDSIILAYAEELESRRGQRNALIVITDGVDNRIYGKLTPSKISYGGLIKAVERMDALIYPVFLGPKPEDLEQGTHLWKGRQQLEQLAAAGGGRLFAGDSAEEMDRVFQQVAEELRAVYSLAYYPKDQDFDGSFREVEIRVKREAATVRTRPGYFAR